MDMLKKEDCQSVHLYSLLSVRTLYTLYLMTYENGFIFPGETHDFWELTFVLHGTCTVTSGNQIFLCQAGNGVLQAPNCFHSLKVEENSSCKLFVVTFDGSGLSSKLCSGQYNFLPDEQRCIYQILKELTLLFGDRDETEFIRFFTSIPLDEISFQIIKSHLELLCLSLARRGNAARGLPYKDSYSICYAKIMDFLQNNIEKKLTLLDISRSVYESPGKIKEVFHRFTGSGIMQYFNRLRCEHVIYLLSEGNSVKDIATIMDFSSPYYLSYFFKRETGMTIREYNKSHIQNKKNEM